MVSPRPSHDCRRHCIGSSVRLTERFHVLALSDSPFDSFVRCSTLSFIELLNTWQPTVIKGNAAEIAALLRSTEVSSRGVDAGRGQAFKDPAEVVRQLARKERCVVVMTGEVDWISDERGEKVVKIENGNELVSLRPRLA